MAGLDPVREIALQRVRETMPASGAVGKRLGKYRLAGRVLRTLGYRPRKPVFIIGTGRCGSSLLTSILSSHVSLVVFPDEANDLWHPKTYPFHRVLVDIPSIIEDPRSFTEISLSSWPGKHERRIGDVFSSYNFLHGPARTLVVKSAMISFMLPKILGLFPDARFCHIYRSGPPVVESLVTKDWVKYSDRFKSQADFRLSCAGYWNACITEINRRDTEYALADRGLLLEFSYEALCADPKAILVQMARFLDVPESGFQFNIQGIRSQDYKVGDYSADPTWRLPLQRMAEGMELKGFVAP
jgi:hypothetical protein